MNQHVNLIPFLSNALEYHRLCIHLHVVEITQTEENCVRIRFPLPAFGAERCLGNRCIRWSNTRGFWFSFSFFCFLGRLFGNESGESEITCFQLIVCRQRFESNVRGLGWSIGKSNGEAVIVKTFRAVKLGHLEVVVALYFISVAGRCYLTPCVELLNCAESAVAVQ